MIPPDFIEELLSRTDIVEVIGQRVTLKKQGHNHTGLCPFHNEKSPSFSVNQDKQFYYCFGCQATGNALKFLLEFDRLDFVAAVEELAGRVGMEVPKVAADAEAPERNERRKSLYDILDLCSQFYRDQLRQHSQRERAIAYLKNRGLSGAVARDFGLGFAPQGWDNLLKSLAKTNHERDLLIEAGMVIDSQEEGKTYDRFRDRIMFPIRDIRGRVIAFGGRVLDDSKPKYLNSPETPVFHKGRELYGLFEARTRNKKLDQVMVVEGYMDVVALAQHGINYCVATLGTATSEEHIERLFRLVSRLVFCFDGDSAGKNAAWKALLTSLPLMRDGLSARFLFLPDGEDPDTLVRKEGKEQFEIRVDGARRLDEVFFDKLSAEVEMDGPDGKASLSKLAMPLIQQIPEGVFRQLMLDRLAVATGLSVDRLLDAYGSQPSRSRRRPLATLSPRPQMPARTNRELANLGVGVLLRSPELVDSFDDGVYQTLAASTECTLFLDLVRTIQEQQIRSPAVLLSAWQDKAEFELLCRIASEEQLLPAEDLPGEYAGIVETLVHAFETRTRESRRTELKQKPLNEMTSAEKAQLLELSKGGGRGRRTT